MARRERSATQGSTPASNNHTPSSPSRPPVICIYAYRPEDRLYISSWATIQGAAALIEALTQDEPDPADFTYVKSQAPTRRVGIKYNSGLRIEADTEAGLEEAIETEVTWELPEPYHSMVKQFLGDTVVAPDDRSTEGRKAKKAPRTRGEPKPQREAGPKAPVGYVHVSSILPDVEPAHARAALRKLGIPKPDYGWWFAPDDKSIVTKIRSALK